MKKLKVNVLRRGSQPGTVVMTRPLAIEKVGHNLGVVVLDELGVEEPVERIIEMFRPLLTAEELKQLEDRLSSIACLPEAVFN